MVLVGSGPASALYFGGYKLVGRYLGEHRPEAPFPNAIAGFSAEVLALTVYTPMDVTKQRLQVAPAGTTVGMMLTTLTRERGVRGLWSGYWAGLMVWGPYSAIFFGVYEQVKEGLLSAPRTAPISSGNSNVVEFLAGVSGGAVGAIITQPLDCIKTRVQVGGQSLSAALGWGAGRGAKGDLQHRAVRPSHGLGATLREVLAHEGPAALMRGTAARVLWLAPGAGVTITLFETIHRLLQSSVHADGGLS